MESTWRVTNCNRNHRPNVRANLAQWAPLRAVLAVFALIALFPRTSISQDPKLKPNLMNMLRQLQESSKDPAANQANPPPPPVPEFEPNPRIPLDVPDPAHRLQVSGQAGKVTVVAKDAAVDQVLDLVAKTHGLNLIASSVGAASRISITLRDVPIEVAIDSIVSIAGLTWVRRDNVILVTPVQGANVIPQVQNRELRVFELDFAAVEDVQKGVQPLLSSNGKVSVLQSQTTEIRQTRNAVIVEDLPPYVQRVAEYIAQVDIAPRQVLIEARVLQIAITDDYLHGVNLLYNFAGPQGSAISLATKGFANPAASQAFLFTLASDGLNAVVEALETSTDSKTLASPRVLCVNGQEARVQVGGQLGFRVLTTTQTSTLEQVQFLDTGVILRIVPYITRDNQVLLRVSPEVSTGRINAQGLPESQVTQVETQVLLPDNQGMVIGGLIQESYSDRQKKIPVIGDIFGVGRLFQRREVDRARTEVVIALLPRIVPYDCQTARRDREELLRTDAPIFRDMLAKNPRPWEPRNYDACENPRCLADTLYFDWRMKPGRRVQTQVPFPTDPASRACMTDDEMRAFDPNRFQNQCGGIEFPMPDSILEDSPLWMETPPAEVPVPVSPNDASEPSDPPPALIKPLMHKRRGNTAPKPSATVSLRALPN